MNLIKKLVDEFQHYFPGNDDIRIFFAPGRVNLIGEHTDYNSGYVLPAALSKGTYMVVRLRSDRQFCLRSANFPHVDINFSIDELMYKRDDDWGNYPKGVIRELLDAGVSLTGADIYYYGDIPNGAGLSSSASIGMATGFGLSQMHRFPISIKEMALLCQRMENHFIGVKTGIMDQYAVGFGKQDYAIFIDCGSMTHELVPLQLGDYKLVITNSNKRRGLADSKYNERRKECEKGLSVIQKIYPMCQTLTDVSLNMLENAGDTFDPIIRKRIRHVVTENQRVIDAVRQLKSGNLIGFGQLMAASHESLRDDYEVTGEHLDVLFAAQKACPGCVGTRMTGAGFGGCTISIVHKNEILSFKRTVKDIYEKKTGLEPDFYICEVGDGVKELTKEGVI
ncbi:galactokinase [Scopulibacillus daqui]|uniref:Galactokinase n=1 Tax=Scopulibacillus daqui TaxID=1469162 RepID=A0ABS2Q0F3_9BACL|nr:galactokinase [Scopulibacillus daqui]MBM7645169.1 galactokinase [Scopulibacillus daqui]